MLGSVARLVTHGSRRLAPLRRGLASVVAPPSSLRNIAIVAHVDHGKTSLVDKLLGECADSAPSEERLLDSGDLEKERGITIMSKATRLDWRGKVLNVVDTPGHADFGGEVERVLSMVDGVLLVVDATEGPMSQTKFVLGKALEASGAAAKKVVVCINKADRPSARLDGEVESEIFDLFALLGASDEQLEYRTFFSSARDGWATEDVSLAASGEAGGACTMAELLDSIVESLPPPNGDDALEAPLAIAVNSVSTDSYVGRLATGKVESGVVEIGAAVRVLRRDGSQGETGKVTHLYGTRGVQRVDLGGSAGAGDIVTIAGVDCGVGDTITLEQGGVEEPLATPPIAPATLSMVFGPNDGPLGGREGTEVTGSKLRARLERETENNVTIEVSPVSGGGEKMEVRGRGELQLGILIENMRREGYEMCVSPPQVLTTTCAETGQKLEPVEEVTVDVDTEYVGTVIEMLADRKGTMIDMRDSGSGKSRLVFEVPSRGLLGFGPQVRSATHGSAIVNSLFLRNDPHLGELSKTLKKGKLISMANGTTTAYALMPLEARGRMYVGSGVEVYDGMVIGEAKEDKDLPVNPVKAKQTTNVRSKQADEKLRLTPPLAYSLEDYLTILADDEVLEVTPKSLRLRKAILDANERKRMQKK